MTDKHYYLGVDVLKMFGRLTLTQMSNLSRCLSGVDRCCINALGHAVIDGTVEMADVDPLIQLKILHLGRISRDHTPVATPVAADARGQ